MIDYLLYTTYSAIYPIKEKAAGSLRAAFMPLHCNVCVTKSNAIRNVRSL